MALSHNSYAQLWPRALLGIPTVTAMDYEHQPANHLAFRLADRILLPAALPAASVRRQGASAGKTVAYPGLKEEIYLGDFTFDASALVRAGVDRARARSIVITRPPPNGAVLPPVRQPDVPRVARGSGRAARVCCVLLARTPAQREWFAGLGLRNFVFPGQALDARSLMYSRRPRTRGRRDDDARGGAARRADLHGVRRPGFGRRRQARRARASYGDCDGPQSSSTWSRGRGRRSRWPTCGPAVTRSSRPSSRRRRRRPVDRGAGARASAPAAAARCAGSQASSRRARRSNPRPCARWSRRWSTAAPTGAGCGSIATSALACGAWRSSTSPAGSSRLTNEDGRVRVVFNGEIYNHARAAPVARGAAATRLASRTDGEVIAHLYEELGEHFVERLDGIFAIALWDARGPAARPRPRPARGQAALPPPQRRRSALRLGAQGAAARPAGPAAARPPGPRRAPDLPLHPGAADPARRGREARAGDRAGGRRRRASARRYWDAATPSAEIWLRGRGRGAARALRAGRPAADDERPPDRGDAQRRDRLGGGGGDDGAVEQPGEDVHRRLRGRRRRRRDRAGPRDGGAVRHRPRGAGPPGRRLRPRPRGDVVGCSRSRWPPRRRSASARSPGWPAPRCRSC